MSAVRKIKGWDGAMIMVDDWVITLGGLTRRIVEIDLDGYARLEGEASTRYVPHLTKLVAFETYAADLTQEHGHAHQPITAEVLPAFLAGLATRARDVPPTGD